MTGLTSVRREEFIKRALICTAAALSILLGLFFAYHLGTVYVAKQTVRTRFALEIGDDPYLVTDERLVYVSAQDSYQVDRYHPTDKLGTVYVNFANGIHVRYDEPLRWTNCIPLSTLPEPANLKPMVAAPPKAN